MTRDNQDEALLRAFATAYLSQASRMSYPQLRQRQISPTVSLYHGAAGLAYTFWRAAALDKKHLRQAQRWARIAYAQQGYRYAFRGAQRLKTVGALSLFYGRPGVPYVEALIASALGEDTTEPLSRFLQMSNPKRAVTEMVQGAAGYLSALSVLYEETNDQRLIQAGTQLCSSLMAELPTLSQERSLGFAHGQSGVVYGLLRWGQASHQKLLGAFYEWLEALSASPPHLNSQMPRSWCNGSAGFVLLLAKAYEQTRDPRYLQRAQAAGHFTFDASGVDQDICCGLAGRAYALLTLEHIDPAQGWRDKALALCVAALNQEPWLWPNGLFRGYPGLVCLSLDLLRGVGSFPLVG